MKRVKNITASDFDTYEEWLTFKSGIGASPDCERITVLHLREGEKRPSDFISLAEGTIVKKEKL